jgi:glucosylglycerate phosphorylase
VSTRELLGFLYGRERGEETVPRLERLLRGHRKRLAHAGQPAHARPLSEKDAFLIAYGDHFSCPGRTALSCLDAFLARHATGSFTGIHILPFFPASSDEGFSVMDYRAVDSALGSWRDVRRIAGRFRLMMDLVLNHASTQGRWFRDFLKRRRGYCDYFITEEQGADLREVFRPRSHPLLTPFQTGAGELLVWTTFSADQADLDYRNPRVLLEMVDILLGYIERGAQVIRLDAVGYLWKESGTSCMHLPRTHAVVRFLRSILDALCPWVIIVTETNVPHRQNQSYLGNGSNEAHMIYNFTLPPLVLDAFHRGDASILCAWARGLTLPPGGGAFMNFLSSHDGIGLVPARDFLSEEKVGALMDMTRRRGGQVSFRADDSPYELNIAWLDAISGPAEPEELRLEKYVTSHLIMMSLAGVPAIWVNSLLGAPSDAAAAARTGSRRSITRRRFALEEAESMIGPGGGLPARIHAKLVCCLAARCRQPAFHPQGAQKVIPSDGPLFCLLRTSPDGSEAVACIHNTGPMRAVLNLDQAGLPSMLRGDLEDLLGGGLFRADFLSVGPFQALWLARSRTGGAAEPVRPA